MEVVVARDAQEVAAGAAALVLESTAGAIAARGRARVAVTGGSSALPLFSQLRGPYRSRIPWDRIDFFFTDERAVPPSHPESNYGMAQRELFSQVPVLDGQVHRMRGEVGDLEGEARRCAEEFRRMAGDP